MQTIEVMARVGERAVSDDGEVSWTGAHDVRLLVQGDDAESAAKEAAYRLKHVVFQALRVLKNQQVAS